MKDKVHEIMEQFRNNDFCMRRFIEKRVSQTGVYRSQHRMLMILGKNQECSQVELSEQMNISPAAVAVTLKKLENGGYVKREYSKGDNRIKRLSVTEKGKAVIHQSIAIFQEVEKDIFEGFSEEELENFSKYLDKMRKNMEEI